MRKYSKNWIQFLRSEHLIGVPTEILAKTEQLFNKTQANLFISADELYRICDRNEHWFQLILNGLDAAQITKTEWRCPRCSREFEFNGQNIERCKNCGEEFSVFQLDDAIIVKVSEFDRDTYNNVVYENRANVLSNGALERGYLIYLHCDIENSQGRMEEDPERFTDYLRKLASEILPDALLMSNGVYLPLFFKGDAFNIVFLDMQDAYRVVKRFINLIRNDDFNFAIYVDKMKFAESDRKGFVRGLDKKWDFNSPLVIKFHRKVSYIKPTEWKECKDYKLKICLLDDAIEYAEEVFALDLRKHEVVSGDFETKHNDVIKYKYVAFCW